MTGELELVLFHDDEAALDPNRGLIGYEFRTERGVLHVTGTSPVAGYLECETADGSFKTLRPVGKVRDLAMVDARRRMDEAAY